MVLLEVAMYIKDIQEEECETAIKVNFIDPQNGKAHSGLKWGVRWGVSQIWP